MIDRFFSKTASLYRRAPSAVYPYDEVDTLYTTFGCAVEALNQNEVSSGMGVHNIRMYRLYCNSTVSILDTDRIEVDSVRYRVVQRIPMDLHPGHHSEYIVESIA